MAGRIFRFVCNNRLGVIPVMMTHVFSTANPMSKGLPRAAGAHGMMIKLTEAREITPYKWVIRMGVERGALLCPNKSKSLG
jgi:hypothetical protein